MEKRNVREKGVANNQISCHSKLDLESSTLAVLESKTINDLRGRSRIKYGMTFLFNNGGFTLIELLVVVLIIGILAAVAVPQYQKAVYKSRAVEAVLVLRSLADAQEVYYLANGEYADEIGKLDVQMSPDLISSELMGAFDNKYSYDCATNRCSARVNNANMPAFQYNFLHTGKSTAGYRYCHLNASGGAEKNDTAKSICQSLGTVDTSATESVGKEWYDGKYFVLN